MFIQFFFDHLQHIYAVQCAIKPKKTSETKTKTQNVKRKIIIVKIVITKVMKALPLIAFFSLFFHSRWAIHRNGFNVIVCAASSSLSGR